MSYVLWFKEKQESQTKPWVWKSTSKRGNLSEQEPIRYNTGVLRESYFKGKMVNCVPADVQHKEIIKLGSLGSPYLVPQVHIRNEIYSSGLIGVLLASGLELYILMVARWEESREAG